MDKSLLVQKQIKDNAEDYHNYVRDLKLWEEEMKRKDKQLSKEPNEETLPPVRKAKLTNKSPVETEENNAETKKKITSFDYSSWDKFDVDKACEEIDNEDNENKNNEKCSEETAAQEEKYLKEMALYEKELGNKHVKANKWNEAIECYTKAIKAYPRDPIFFANRALCYLKKKKYEMVESDCTASLRLDPTYVKAMLRRAAAREATDRLEDAMFDLRNALKLEPNNIQAMKDLEQLKNLSDRKRTTIVGNKEPAHRLDKESISQNTKEIQEEPTPSIQSLIASKIKKEQSQTKKSSAPDDVEPEWEPCSNTIQPINKPPHLRSKKSLKRIEIHDIGLNSSQHLCPATKTTSSLKAQISILPPISSGEVDSVTPSGSAVKPRSILTVTTPVEDVPPPPSTSVQFHKAWDRIKTSPHLRYTFLKQIPGESLPDIFKESLECQMFSSIVETLASEFTANGDPVLGYVRGMTSVQRFSTLALFMSSHDKSNLKTLFNYCLSKMECSRGEVEELQRLYEIKSPDTPSQSGAEPPRSAVT